MTKLACSDEINDALVAAHGLSPEEYARFVALIEREPTLAELGVVSAMWNEHCSYKSSKKWLRTLPTSGEQVIQGPGENAGVVDIGDGLAAVFKMESHNHPSYIEPYQGAATGVGGILRDVFTMGARPVAALNALFFGVPDHPKTRHLLSGAVAGIGGYGNSFGVPTVGGMLNFHKKYNGNCLVNAFALGIARTDQIFYSEARGVGLPVVYLGAKTGRDGVGGATMASSEFDDAVEEKRPTVQVGDPFTEKRLLEACLALMTTGAVIAIQDMGAAGLTCSAVEMGAKGNLGIRLDLDQVPVREQHMTAYDMMLSESQERMLMVLDPSKRDIARDIFTKWHLDFAEIGVTTDDLRFVVRHGGEVVIDLPIKELGDAAPEYDRDWVTPPVAGPAIVPSSHQLPEPQDALLRLLATPDLCSRRWVWEQYDHLIQGNTVVLPGQDAAVIRVETPEGDKTEKGLALCVDVTPRYVHADPYVGGMQAVAECWRNLTCVGARPLAISDNLNFGNPEKPEIMGSLVRAIAGISEAARHLNMPVVSGNVSLYNETNGQPIMPTPTIAAVGLLPCWRAALSAAFGAEGEAIILVGGDPAHLGQSLYLREFADIEVGAPPAVDLRMERRNGDFIRDMILAKRIIACHDLSDGGLAVAVAEMALLAGIGAKLSLPRLDPSYLFGEDQGRYVVSCSQQNLDMLLKDAEDAGVCVQMIGTTGADYLQFSELEPISLSTLRAAREAWLPAYAAGCL